MSLRDRIDLANYFFKMRIKFISCCKRKMRQNLSNISILCETQKLIFPSAKRFRCLQEILALGARLSSWDPLLCQIFSHAFPGKNFIWLILGIVF